VFASKTACFKCGTTKTGEKGKGKGEEPPPDKFSTELWEAPRTNTGLKLIGETVPQGVHWDYKLMDESRRSYAAFLPCPFTKEQCTTFFETARDQTDWKQPDGPTGPIPRKTSWMVAKGCECTYRYGRIEVEPQEYPPWMISVMQLVMPLCGFPDPSTWPNSCNMNLYEDGGMSVGWHSDDERLFQGKFQDIRILSLSLGIKRRFEIRANWPGEGENPIRTLLLGDGDLCTMEGMMQKHFCHRVPKEPRVQGPRINMTWRWTVKHAPKCPAGRPRRF
jgi:alkylated DNA repair dioxygenase AlkB